MLALLIGAPLAGFVVLAVSGRRLHPWLVATVAVLAVTLSAVGACLAALRIAGGEGLIEVTVWRWLDLGGLRADVAFVLDPLAVVMALVITVIGALIHLYATAYMRGDPGYGRFFAAMNLFVAMMLVLVLARDLVLLYVGWEGVGLASYLLIGFWYGEPQNAAAARKAFLVTRIGDTALLIAIFLLQSELGTLELAGIGPAAAATWSSGASMPTLVALLVFLGAAGKSAQLPLHTWLPDAMAGPTPVSALIHAATMVTAGVYLVARLLPLFILSPAAMLTVAAVGGATLLLGAMAALAQRDLKRLLAYSTMSQLGYMFVALGAGAPAAAIFHLVTHAFFKALLFLAAGVVIESTHEPDVTRLSGLGRVMPLTTACFVAGAAALAGLPLVSAGWFSKELILSSAWRADLGWLWLLGTLGAGLTALYAFRAVVLIFTGAPGASVRPRRDLRLLAPLAPLAVGSIAAGYLAIPEWLALPAPALPEMPHSLELALAAVAGAASLGGALAAWRLFASRRRAATDRSPIGKLARGGFGFDTLYESLFGWPYRSLAEAAARDPIDRGADGIVASARGAYRLLAATQRGLLRWYAVGILAGSLAVVTAVVLR